MVGGGMDGVGPSHLSWKKKPKKNHASVFAHLFHLKQMESAPAVARTWSLTQCVTVTQ